MFRPVAVVAAVLVALAPLTAAGAPAWEQWQAVPGVFDLGGPRADGSLLVAGKAALYTLTPDGTLSPFARGAGGYRDDPGAEAYLATSPGLSGSGCTFARDDIFILRLHTPVGVTRVSASGDETGSFANLDAPSLGGIAFDTVGTFGHRLLVTGSVSGKTEVAAIDCTGAVQVITRTAPVVEGGIAVAPMSFGSFGGALIAPDELSGIIWAIRPDGSSAQVVNSGLPKGGDIGVESVDFVPAGFAKGGYAYYADRATPGNPHPGTDHVLRLSSADLMAAGVQEGDLLAATEGGATVIDVRCDSSCRVTTVIGTPTAAHGEGHLAFTLTLTPSPHPTTSPSASAKPAAASSTPGIPPLIVLLFGAVVGAGAALLAVFAIRRRRT